MPSTGCAIGKLILFVTLVTSPSVMVRASIPDPFAVTAPGIKSNAASASDSTEIRVHVTDLKDTTTFSGVSLRVSGLEQSFTGYRAIRVTWTYVQAGMNLWHIEDRDSHAVLGTVKAGELQVHGEKMRTGLRPVKGSLTLLASHSRRRANEVSLIASLDLETYVRGVLPSEMPQSWPLAALKSQAVAARTFAMYRKREREKIHAPYDVDSDVSDQMFELPGWQEGADQALAAVEKAVRETRGIVLATAGPHPHFLAAYYHADCGGRTEDARAVWGPGAQTLGTVVDDGCPLNPLAKWKTTLTGHEIALKILGAAQAGAVELADFAAVGQTPSGRAKSVRLTWSDGQTTSLAAHEFRMAIGSERLKSTFFKSARIAPDRFEFTGQGFGHGVGLCQWGSRALAANGSGYQSILKHYYQNARLVRIY